MTPPSSGPALLSPPAAPGRKARNADAPDHATISGRIIELHGLRGLALLLVVVFHLFGAGRVSGGVDVFLFVSGFMATRQIVTRGHRGTFRFGQHYARLLSRLVPTALIVLVAVATAAWMLMPAERWTSIGREIVASVLFYENWELIASQLAYGAAGPSASPLQHFWSLAVQAQFLLVWPLVAAPLVRLTARSRRLWFTTLVLLACLMPVVALSFGHAVTLSAEAQSVAYLDSTARVWQLALGAVVALVTPFIRLPGGLRAVLGWLGLGLVVTSGFLFDGAALFPGPYALWPVLGAALVLVGSGSGSDPRWAPVGILASRPLRFIADISYELYLWHWPILVFFLLVSDSEAVTWQEAAVVLVASGLLAWLTHIAVAEPLRYGGTGRGALVVVALAMAATAAVAVPTTHVVDELDRRRAAELAALSEPSPDHPGAAALRAGFTETTFSASFQPSTAAAHLDVPLSVANGCRQESGDAAGYEKVVICDVHDPGHPHRTVVIAGASHAFQWEPPFQQIAEHEGWRLVTVAKAGCRFAIPAGPQRTDGTDCDRWQRSAVDTILGMSPDLVVVVGTDTSEGAERVSPAQVAAWQALDEAGITVLTIRDTPRSKRLAPSCVERHGPHSAECGLPRRELFDRTNPVLTFDGVPADARHIDLTDWICRSTTCPPVIGNVLVYRDWDHLSGTYARTLTPMLTDRLRAEVPWMF
ncbi:acyltransferase family protein [Myceligenerans halotolerans]